MFTKNFNLSDSLIETAAKLLEESSKKASKNPSSTDHEENMTEASNEEPNINHLELSEEELNELSSGTMKSYVKKVAATPAGQVKASREKGIEMASKKLRNEEDVNEEPIDEISRGLASRYISKAKATDPEKRNKGIGLALQKKYGDKKYGTTEPKVKATEEEVMPKGMSMKERTAFHMAAAAAVS